MSHIHVSLHFFLSIIDSIDYRSMVFPTEVIPYLFQSPSEILLGKKHENLSRNSDFFSSGIRFKFTDSYIIILCNHIYEIGKIGSTFGIGLNSFLCIIHFLL